MTSTPDEPVGRVRPTAVTVAFWLQLAAVFVLLVAVGLSVAGAVQFDGQIDRAAARVPDADPDEVSGERFGNVFMTVLVCLPALVLAGWLAATARPVLRGGGTARVLVYVAGGAQLLCCFGQGCLGFAVLPLFLLGDEWMEPTTGPDGEPVWEESEFLETLYGSAGVGGDLLSAAGGLGAGAALLLTLAVVLLLALPPGSRYFQPDEGEKPSPPPGSWPWPPTPAASSAYPTSAASSAHPTPVTSSAYPTSAASSAYPGPANPGVPHVVPVLPPGYPAYYTVPPGYLICPDPSRHLPPPPQPEGQAQPEGPAQAPPTTPGS